MAIPNVFHFVFGLKPQTEPFHLAFHLAIESCRVVNEPDEIYFYFHHEPHGRYWELTRPHVRPVRVPLNAFVDRFRYTDRGIDPYRYAHHADFIRLERLLERGGVYADIDTVFVRPIPERLWQQSFVLGREGNVVTPSSPEPQPSLCNAFIMAEPGAAFGRRWLAAMEEAFDGTWSEHSTLLPERLRREHAGLLHVEPPATFYKHPCTPDGIAALFERRDDDLEGVVSFHLWSHLWWSWRRRDFSRFHAGRLTEAFVARGDTTYGRVARPFLPEPLGNGERRRRHWRELWSRG